MSEVFTFRVWPDGVEQYSHTFTSISSATYVERVTAPSKPRGWCVVNRHASDEETTVYPPVLSGPYESAEEAQAAYLFLSAAGRI